MGSRLLVLLVAPVLVAAFCIFGPFTTDPALLFSGLATDLRPGWLPGFGTADPNMGITADALGKRAALEISRPPYSPRPCCCCCRMVR